MKTYNYRDNLFNNNYIIITTTIIISKYNKCKNNNTNQNAIFWYNLYNTLKEANIAANSPIAISKDTIYAKIIMNELTQEEKNITLDDIKNACLIAVYENNPFANHLAYIAIKNSQVNNFGSATEFAKQYGKNVTNFIIHNNSIQEYQNQTNGKLPYEYDRHVFLYENDTIRETYLPVPTLNKGKTKVKSK